MKYHITFDNPLLHLIKIRLEISNIKGSYIELKLPIWRPGRYEAANYAKNIQKISFYDGAGTTLPYDKLSASRWNVINGDSSTVYAEYWYYAHQMDAGNSWFGENLIYINFINCMLYNENRINEEHEIEIDLPDGYLVGCGLMKSGKILMAKDYYALVDSPLLASKDLQLQTYKAKGVDFNIWIYGNHTMEVEILIEQFKLFSECQISQMEGFPEEDYHFLLIFTPNKFYHGVEHANSTVICIGPGEELNKPELYNELLGVSSHELFHAWNICKIRPNELMPYDFGQPAIFPTGYVAEGFTTYYGDVFLVRSGVFDKNWYLNELTKLFNRHFSNFGRLINSVVDSSYDLWVDGYQPSAPHKKSSIYVEGAMIALSIDLTIRKYTQNVKSLDDVMAILYWRYGQTEKGYSHSDIKSICEEVSKSSFDLFFKDYVDGTKDKVALVSELIGFIGCDLEINDSQYLLERALGVKTMFDEQGCKVVQIMPNSTGEKYFSIKDKILSLNGININPEMLENLARGPLEFEIERNFKKKKIQIEINGGSYLKKYKVKQKKSPTEEQRDSFKKWLNHRF